MIITYIAKNEMDGAQKSHPFRWPAIRCYHWLAVLFSGLKKFRMPSFFMDSKNSVMSLYGVALLFLPGQHFTQLLPLSADEVNQDFIQLVPAVVPLTL